MGIIDNNYEFYFVRCFIMLNLFVCAERRAEYHTGEEYDEIVFVEDEPSSLTTAQWADRIRGRIRKLWNENSENEEPIEIMLDAHPVFHVMLVNLKLLLEDEEGIKIELGYELEEPEITDSETLKVLEKFN